MPSDQLYDNKLEEHFIQLSHRKLWLSDRLANLITHDTQVLKGNSMNGNSIRKYNTAQKTGQKHITHIH